MTYVVEIPIGNGSRLAGPFPSYSDAQEFAEEMGGTWGLEVRRLVSPALARALTASVTRTRHERAHSDMTQTTYPEES